MKLLNYSQTSTAASLKFVNGKIISSHTLLGMLLFLHVSKRGPKQLAPGFLWQIAQQSLLELQSWFKSLQLIWRSGADECSDWI